MSKGEFESILNDCGSPEHDLKSNGGRCPDKAKYGTWLRKNDPIAFEVEYRDHVAEEKYDSEKCKNC